MEFVIKDERSRLFGQIYCSVTRKKKKKRKVKRKKMVQLLRNFSAVKYFTKGWDFVILFVFFSGIGRLQ